MARKPTPSNIETEILSQSKRRCCLCAYLNSDFEEKRGQIAHIDQNPQNNRFDNLVWLCLEHHSIYDSRTSQHKNYSSREVKRHRDWLYRFMHPVGAPVELRRDDPSMPFCLHFDGVNDTVYYSGTDLLNLHAFIVEGKFRLEDTRYGGSFLSINGIDNQALLRLRYFYHDHDEYPGQVVVYIFNTKHEKLEAHSAIQIDSNVWMTFKVVVGEKRITCQINSLRTIAIEFDPIENIRLIQIGAYGVGSIPPGHMDPLACYFSYFKIYDIGNDSLICHYLFDYGMEYLLSLPKSDRLVFHGGDFSDRTLISIPMTFDEGRE